MPSHRDLTSRAGSHRAGVQMPNPALAQLGRPAFRRWHRDGCVDVGKIALSDYINATIGFEELASITNKPPKGSHAHVRIGWQSSRPQPLRDHQPHLAARGRPARREWRSIIGRSLTEQGIRLATPDGAFLRASRMSTDYRGRSAHNSSLCRRKETSRYTLRGSAFGTTFLAFNMNLDRNPDISEL